MSLLGSPEQFSGDDFKSYKERLEAFFTVNDIGTTAEGADAVAVAVADKQKVAYTISIIGKDTYGFLKDLCLPNKPTDKTFTEICTLLQNYYKPSILVVAEAYKFHQAKHEVGESVSTFANRLRRLSVNCNFGTFLDRALQDQFVCGIRSQNILKTLLSQDKSITGCIEIAVANEAAEKESRSFTNNTEPVNYTQKHNSWKNKKDGNNKCFQCGADTHFADKCPVRNTGVTCNYYKNPNHVTKECFKSDGIMEKVEFSEWASPVVLKSDGEIRICGDYSSTINKQIKSDVYPLPLEDVISKIGNGECFTKLDLKQAFHQFELTKESRKYTTINTTKGLYQYNRCVGIPPATAICQRTMESILNDLP